MHSQWGNFFCNDQCSIVVENSRPSQRTIDFPHSLEIMPHIHTLYSFYINFVQPDQRKYQITL